MALTRSCIQSKETLMADDLVLTPGGFRSKSLVHAFEPDHGLTLLDSGDFADVELATGKSAVITKPSSARSEFRAHGPTGAGSPSLRPTPALPSGWQIYAWWDSDGKSITYFGTDWVVPPAPKVSSGQTVFIFNGIQNTGANYGILQPVLQWGSSAAGGGAYWSVASWYVTSGGQAFHTKLVRVNPGDKLQGVMTQTSVSGSKYDYDSAFHGIANTTLKVSKIAPLHWANETLECYGMEVCSNFPNTGDTDMSAIEIRIGSTHPKLKWTPVDAVTNCKQHTVVVNDANPHGEIALHYN